MKDSEHSQVEQYLKNATEDGRYGQVRQRVADFLSGTNDVLVIAGTRGSAVIRRRTYKDADGVLYHVAFDPDRPDDVLLGIPA